MRYGWFIALALALAAPVGGLIAADRALAPTGSSHEAVIVAIKPGMGVSAIAHKLEQKGLVRSALAFMLYARLSGADRSMKAGVYACSPDMGARGILDTLVEGKGAEKRLTVPEGFSLRQIAAECESRAPGAGARFLDASASARPYLAEYPWLKALPAGASLEGFCFPDTYVVAPGPDAERDLVRIMLARFAQVALPAIEEGAAGRLSLLQTVTMASIVEKEAKEPTERPTIAGVFFNRLASHMPFGSDPTVEYALQKHQDEKGLSLRDVAVDSPYNTYKYPGLPPGPIANPGLASIQAVLQPEKTPYLYFVARGDGSHAFTRTYQEHLATQRRLWAARKKTT